MSKAKAWFCSRINVNTYEPGYLTSVCDECAAIEKDGYKVEQIVCVGNQYQIFYSRKEK